MAIDSRPDTGNPKTQFIFNMARGEILEYSREIVTPKLRELRADEADALLKDLQTAHQRARTAALSPRQRAKVEPAEVLGWKSDDLAEDTMDK